MKIQGNPRTQTIRLTTDADESRLLRRCLWTRAVAVNELYRHKDFSSASAQSAMRRERAWLNLRDRVLHPGRITLSVEEVSQIANAIKWALAEHEKGRAIQDKEDGFQNVPLLDSEAKLLGILRIALSTESHCLRQEAPE